MSSKGWPGDSYSIAILSVIKAQLSKQACGLYMHSQRY